jgi:hypothetical protein
VIRTWKVVQVGQSALAAGALAKMSSWVTAKDRSGAPAGSQIDAAVTLGS